MSPSDATTLPAAETDASENAVRKKRRIFGIPRSEWPRILAPLIVGIAVIGGWEALVRFEQIPFYVLPGPFVIVQTLIRDWPSLSVSLLVTLQITFMALFLAAGIGLLLSVLFSQSRLIELSFFPYAVILQVTPIVAIAPLIIIYVGNVRIALLICAWIVAFFPILSNTTVGLHSANHELLDMFKLYRATRGQTLWHLRLPAAMPYFLAGLRISGGLSLIGSVVAEFVAGSGGRASGLAYRILESAYQLQIPRMYAALLLIALTGVVIYGLLSFISYLCLRKWHESSIRRES